ncbi:MAG: hypothetical protein DRQ89_14295 [Epsilonproteobacteria bacterium]|nr:MAG: hypothetical protein DRQ89_14295 [Campylobacterota bacterium]
MKKLILISLFILTGCTEPPAPLKRVGIVLDLTVKSKVGIINKLDKVAELIFATKALELRNTKITIYFVDQNGTGLGSDLGHVFHSTRNGRLEFNRSLEILDLNLQAVRDRILNDETNYGNTLLISPIREALSENQRVHIISDFLIVDKYRNMERGRFGKQIDLTNFSKNKEIQLHFVAPKRMGYKSKDKLKKFWTVAFFGHNK